MHHYSRPSIKNQGGVLQFLNATIEQHNGVDGKLFKKLVDNGVNTANISRLSGKSYAQVKHWVDVYKAEQGMKVVATDE